MRRNAYFIMLGMVIFLCTIICVTIFVTNKTTEPDILPITTLEIETFSPKPTPTVEIEITPETTENQTEKPTEEIITIKPTESVTATPTATPTIKQTQTPTPVITATPTSTIKPTTKATATPTITATKTFSINWIVTPAPTSTVDPDTTYCSMVDYTEIALPSEQKPKDVKILLAAVKTGNFDEVTLSYDEMATFMYTHSYCVWYISDTSTYSEYVEILDWADDVIEELRISRQTPETEALKLINNYVIKYITYDLTRVTDELYYTINSHLGVCHNYTQMFQLLCHKCGIKCYYETNKTQNHAYSCVIIADEKLYTDSTWNDVKVNIGGTAYEIFEAADVIWANASETKKVKTADGSFNKQQFIEFYTRKYFLQTRADFITAHEGWSESDIYNKVI